MTEAEADGSSEMPDRWRDEMEQLRTALKAAQEELAAVAAERERLRLTLDNKSSEFTWAIAAQGVAGEQPKERVPRRRAGEGARETEEELRIAIKELQVRFGNLHVANQQLMKRNQELDHDVTKRSVALGVATAALGEGEASFGAVADLGPYYLWQSDATGHVRWFSRRWYALTGQREEEALGDGWLGAVYPDDLDRLTEAYRSALARGEAYEIEARVESSAGGPRWFLMRAEPVRDETGAVAQWLGVGTDIRNQRLTYEALEASERRFRALIEGIPQLVWRSHEGGEWSWSSRQWTDFTGLSEEASRGLGWIEAYHPDDRAAALAAWKAAGSHGDFSTEGRIFNVIEQRYRHFRTRAKAVTASDGSTIEWLGTSTDVDDIIRLQNQQSVLVAELQHRTRNILAVVQSVVRRTVRGSSSLDEFARRADHRLAALARVLRLLSQRADSRRITFDQLLRTEIGAHVSLDEAGNGAQVTTSGPADVPLFSAAVQPMALAIHELVTNALKYGALATPDGHLDVSWRLLGGGDPRLLVEWRESGVTDLPAPTDPPRGGGYGRELIERALPYQLHARTSFGFEKDGVRCTIEVPVARTIEGGST